MRLVFLLLLSSPALAADFDLIIKNGRIADGTGAPERLTKVPHAQAPLDFSRDGKQMLIRERPGSNGDDVSVMSMDTRVVTPLLSNLLGGSFQRVR